MCDSHHRDIFNFVTEVKSTGQTARVTELLQEGWVLLGVFGNTNPIYSLGRVPTGHIPAKESRFGVKESNGST